MGCTSSNSSGKCYEKIQCKCCLKSCNSCYYCTCWPLVERSCCCKCCPGWCQCVGIADCFCDCCESCCPALPGQPPDDMQTIIGNGTEGSGDQQLAYPLGMCRYTDVITPCLLVADGKAHRIRKGPLPAEPPEGKSELIYPPTKTLLGSSAAYRDGAVESAAIKSPYDIVCDTKNDIVYFTSDHAVRQVKTDERDNKMKVMTLCGHAKSGFTDGVSKKARFMTPRGLCVSRDGRSIYICDYDSLRRIDVKSRKVTTLWGSKPKMKRGPTQSSGRVVVYADEKAKDQSSSSSSSDSDDIDSKNKKKAVNRGVELKVPRFVVFDPHTYTLETALYITGANALYRYDIPNNTMKVIPVGPAKIDPFGLSVTPNGKILVASNSTAHPGYRTGVFIVDPATNTVTPVATNERKPAGEEDVIELKEKFVKDVGKTESKGEFNQTTGLLLHWDNTVQACFVSDSQNHAVRKVSLRRHRELFDALPVKAGEQELPPVANRSYYDPYGDSSSVGSHHKKKSGGSEAQKISDEVDDNDSKERNVRCRMIPTAVKTLNQRFSPLPPIATVAAANCKGDCSPGTCKGCDLRKNKERELQLMWLAWQTVKRTPKGKVIDREDDDPEDAPRCVGYDPEHNGQCRKAGNSFCKAQAVTDSFGRGSLCRNCCAELHWLQPELLRLGCDVHGVAPGGIIIATGKLLAYEPPWDVLQPLSDPNTPAISATPTATVEAGIIVEPASATAPESTAITILEPTTPMPTAPATTAATSPSTPMQTATSHPVTYASIAMNMTGKLPLGVFSPIELMSVRTTISKRLTEQEGMLRDKIRSVLESVQDIGERTRPCAGYFP